MSSLFPQFRCFIRERDVKSMYLKNKVKNKTRLKFKEFFFLAFLKYYFNIGVSEIVHVSISNCIRIQVISEVFVLQFSPHACRSKQFQQIELNGVAKSSFSFYYFYVDSKCNFSSIFSSIGLEKGRDEMDAKNLRFENAFLHLENDNELNK